MISIITAFILGFFVCTGTFLGLVWYVIREHCQPYGREDLPKKNRRGSRYVTTTLHPTTSTTTTTTTFSQGHSCITSGWMVLSHTLLTEDQLDVLLPPSTATPIGVKPHHPPPPPHLIPDPSNRNAIFPSFTIQAATQLITRYLYQPSSVSPPPPPPSTTHKVVFTRLENDTLHLYHNENMGESIGDIRLSQYHVKLHGDIQVRNIIKSYYIKL